MLDIKSALILREKTLTHYDRMIAMVNLTIAIRFKHLQNKSLFGKQTLIDILIGESPCGDFCPLCKTAETCGYCAIVKTTGVYQCRSTPWLKILDVKDKKSLLEMLTEERDFLADLDYTKHTFKDEN